MGDDPQTLLRDEAADEGDHNIIVRDAAVAPPFDGTLRRIEKRRFHPPWPQSKIASNPFTLQYFHHGRSRHVDVTAMRVEPPEILPRRSLERTEVVIVEI